MKKSISIVMVLLVPLWVVSGCGYGGGGSGDGGNGDGQDGNGNCITHNITTCEEGVAYWVDSCGTIEEVKEMCSCGCNAGGTDCETCTDLPCQSNSDCPTGWVCDLNTNKCKPQGCTQNADCPQGYYCDLTVNQCKRDTCVPNCTGKCCGGNGCGGTCPNACVPGEVCDLGTCLCKLDVQCISNEDCPQGYYCDLTVNECKEVVCTPNCTGKCCGSDGCGSTCPNTCSTGYTCDPGSCLCMPYCTSNSQCGNMQCCREGTCMPAACGNMVCGYDPVCGFSCGTCPTGYACNYETGQCISDTPGDLCPTGQDCLMISDGGLLGCLIPPDMIPSSNPTCSPDLPCDGNFSCYCMDTECTESICIENCGTCPAGLTCWLLWDGGPSGCLTAEGALPADTPACDTTDYSCAGNATCYQETSTGNLICINNCSDE
jgi:Cys-rich repeat protein